LQDDGTNLHCHEQEIKIPIFQTNMDFKNFWYLEGVLVKSLFTFPW
jgi:hypothetical protein